MTFKTVTAFVLSVACAATLSAAPQTSKPTAKPAPKAAPTAKPAAAKPAMVTPAEIPQVVTEAVMKAHPKASITGATKSTKGTETWYTVHYTTAKGKGSMKLDEMGKPTMKAMAKKKK